LRGRLVVYIFLHPLKKAFSQEGFALFGERVFFMERGLRTALKSS
jgi:hypothetical protein